MDTRPNVAPVWRMRRLKNRTALSLGGLCAGLCYVAIAQRPPALSSATLKVVVCFFFFFPSPEPSGVLDGSSVPTRLYFFCFVKNVSYTRPVISTRPALRWALNYRIQHGKAQVELAAGFHIVIGQLETLRLIRHCKGSGTRTRNDDAELQI